MRRHPPIRGADRQVFAASRLFQLSLALVLLVIWVSSVHAQSELVIQKSGTKQYHRPGCPVVSDAKNVVALTKAQAEGRGLEEHDCKLPSDAREDQKPDAPTYVYVDGGKHYHETAKCVRLDKDEDEVQKLKLDEAGRKFWPCPVCKPPIRKRPR